MHTPPCQRECVQLFCLLWKATDAARARTIPVLIPHLSVNPSQGMGILAPSTSACITAGRKPILWSSHQGTRKQREMGARWERGLWAAGLQGREIAYLLHPFPRLLFILQQVSRIRFMLANHEAYQINTAAAGVWLSPQAKSNKVDIVSVAKVMR